MLLASSTEPAQTLQRVTTRALDPVRQTLTGIGSGVAGLFGTIGEIDRLRSENAELRVAVAGAEQRIAELSEAARENEELRQLLGITEALDMDSPAGADHEPRPLELHVGGRGRRRDR